MDTVEHDWHLFMLTLSALCAFFDLIILLTLIVKLYRGCWGQQIEENETKFEFNKAWALIFILGVILTAISDFIHLYMGNIAEDESIYGNEYRFIITATDTFYFFYTIQLYTFLIYRVYSIFKNTEYNISKNTMIVFLILFIINFSLMMYYLIIAIQVEHSIDGDTFNPLLWIPLICSDILINVAIMAVMISKLRKLVIVTSIPDHEEAFDDDSMVDLHSHSQKGTSFLIEIDDHSKTYVDIMSKYTVLSAIIVIFNQIFGSFVLFTVLLKESNSYNNTYINIIQFIGYTMRDIEGTIDCLVVYLTFKINQDTYNNWCCCCHNVLHKLFMTNIQKKIKKYADFRKSVINIQDRE